MVDLFFTVTNIENEGVRIPLFSYDNTGCISIYDDYSYVQLYMTDKMHTS